MEEVAKWSAAGFPILRILFTAAVGMKGNQSRLSDYWVPRVLRQVRQGGDETSLW